MCACRVLALAAIVGTMLSCGEKPSAPSAFLALGDSYTIGEAVKETERWPVQLADRLREQGIDLGQPTIIAATGVTTDELMQMMDQRKPTGPFKLVSLLIGVNNQFRGANVERYRRELVILLERARVLAGGERGRVIVVSIPDWSATEAGRNEPSNDLLAAQIEVFNKINREEADRAGVRYVDVTTMSRRAATQPDLTSYDMVHPSGRMYAEWVRLILPVARQALAGEPVAASRPAR